MADNQADPIYSGMVVGGPIDGQRLESRSRFYRVAVLPEGFAPPTPGEAPRPPDLKIVEYVWRYGRWYPNAH